MNEKIFAGKNAVIFVIGLLILTSFLTIINYVVNIGFDKILVQLIRFILTCGLCYLLYKGFKPIRVLLIILSILAIASSIKGLFMFSSSVIGGLVSLLYLVIYILVFILLLRSENIKLYMDYKRGKVQLDTTDNF